MRTEANGIAFPSKPRPQVWDPDQIANWRRYAKLRTQLYPYLVAADAAYQESGLPIMRHLSLAYPRDRAAIAREDEFLFGPDLLAAPVLEPGATERTLYLPRGRWVDFWRAVEYEESTGALALGPAELLRGHRELTVPAPLEELPLLARAGTMLPLLPPDVDTLTDYPDDSTVALDERDDELVALAFPHRQSSARLYGDEWLHSRERKQGWVLRIEGESERTYRIRASLRTLAKRFEPCGVSVDGEPLASSRWAYDRQSDVLSAELRAQNARLVAREFC
jgi:alpha-glucosidase (family GH31 glycosyl hydrolase)